MGLFSLVHFDAEEGKKKGAGGAEKNGEKWKKWGEMMKKGICLVGPKNNLADC